MEIPINPWMIWGVLTHYFRKHPYQSTTFAGLQISWGLLSIQPPQWWRSRGKLFPPLRWRFVRLFPDGKAFKERGGV